MLANSFTMKTSPQPAPAPAIDCACAECPQLFPTPLIGRCPHCGSRQLRAPNAQEQLAASAKRVLDTIARQDVELARSSAEFSTALQRVIGACQSILDGVR